MLHVVTQLDADIGQRILVADAPNQYRGMILVTSNGCLCTLLQHLVESRVIEVPVTITERNLIDDIEAEGIGQLIEPWLSWIMTGADKVDRSLFHQLHVAQDAGIINHLYSLGVSSMACDTTQFDGLSVEPQNITIDSQFAKTKLVLKGLECLVLLKKRGA